MSPNPVSPTLTHDQDFDPGTRKPVRFKVKETDCPRTTQQPLEQCDFKKNGVSLGAGEENGRCFPGIGQRAWGRFPIPGRRPGGYDHRGSSLTLNLPFQLVKQCVGTVTLDPSNDQFDLNCNEVSGPFWTGGFLGKIVCGTSFVPMTRCPIQGRQRPSYPGPSFPKPQVSSPGAASLRAVVLYWGSHLGTDMRWILRTHSDFLNLTLEWGPAIWIFPRPPGNCD